MHFIQETMVKQLLQPIFAKQKAWEERCAKRGDPDIVVEGFEVPPKKKKQRTEISEGSSEDEEQVPKKVIF
jgi:hypothetical protein